MNVYTLSNLRIRIRERKMGTNITKILIISVVIFLAGCFPSINAYNEATSESRLKDIQGNLITLGYLKGRADGKMGPKTRDAITRYQKDDGITPNGKVNFELYLHSKNDAARGRKPQKSTSGQRPNTSARNKGSRSVSLISKISAPTGSPSKELIERVIKDEITNAVPGKWIGKTIDGREARFSHMEIVKWGKVGSNPKYYPVRVKLMGRCKFSAPWGGTVNTEHFDAIAEFRFYQDDFGDWKWAFTKPSVFG